MANIRNVVFAREDRHINMKLFIEINPYIKNRLHNYLGGIMDKESYDIIRKYSSIDAEIILKE